MTLEVLIVEDEPFVRSVFRTMLSKQGEYKLYEAQTGHEGVLIVESHSLDIVFLDLNMPGSDGMDFLKKLKDIPVPPPIVILSGEEGGLLSGARKLATLYGLDIFGVVNKPIRSSQLSEYLFLVQNRLRPITGTKSDNDQVPVSQIEEIWSTGDIVCFFQPQFRINDLKIVGFEALVRLRNSKGEYFSPMQFLQWVEEKHLMLELTEAVAVQAIEFISKLATQNLTISINVPALAMESESFGLMISNIAHRFGVDHKRIILELTEQGLPKDSAELLLKSMRLRMHGFRLSIDDFGTGYSSLEKLKELPFHELKIDRDFVQSISDSQADLGIVRSNLELAKGLNLTSVAEGIETEAQLKKLRALGCEIGQGFLISKPLNEKDALAFFESQLSRET